MSLVGLGRAFNLRYRPSTKFVGFSRPMPPMPIPMGGNFSYTENVKIQNGPSGFWGFMSGLFGGLMGGGMMGGGLNIFSLLNQLGIGKTQQTTSQGTQATDHNDPDHQKDLANFKTLYGDKFNIVYENGKFMATTNDKANTWVGDGATFEELNNKLKEYNKGNTQEADGKPTQNNDAKPSENGNDGNSTVTNNNNGNSHNSSSRVSGDSHSSSRSSSTGEAKKALHHVPSGWYRSDTKTGKENVGLKLSQCKTAEQVANKVLSSKMDYLSADAKKAITQEIIANNPSIFDNKGNVISNKWDKLDLPSVDYIKSKYMSGNATKHTNKQSGVTYVSYKDKAGKTHNQNSGINSNKNEKVWKGANNYTVKYTAKGAMYFDANGNRKEAKTFRKYCPNMADAVDKYINAKTQNNK
ncbi:MAG: hypothetical protein SPL70_06470 [Cyanobacteriota bacterium]|nr:hypothetical protein [Cyanobacteriota bacterium]MDY6383526.1 hypothetical protein [Cyanobacteriota bacterium]